jgi:hypothetical protein
LVDGAAHCGRARVAVACRWQAERSARRLRRREAACRQALRPPADPGPYLNHGQHPEGVREVPRVDRANRAGVLAFETRANAVRAPPLPITVRSRPAASPLGLARSVTRATCSPVHRRTAAADARASVPQLLARRQSTTTTASLRPGCRARRPLPREPADSNWTLRVQRAGWARVLVAQHTFTASVSPCAAPLVPSSSLPLERSTAYCPSLRPARDHGGQRTAAGAGSQGRSFVHLGKARAAALVSRSCDHCDGGSCLVSQPSPSPSLFACTGGRSPASENRPCRDADGAEHDAGVLQLAVAAHGSHEEHDATCHSFRRTG